MKKIFKSAGIALLLLTGTLVFAQDPATTGGQAAVSAEASALAKLKFPIPDLGNCSSREACKLYCDDSAHKDACLTYAQKAGIMAKEKVAAARNIIAKKGPGGCFSRESCVAYCEDSSHQDECMSFAEKNKIITEEKATVIKRIIKGEAPGACKSPETCRMYCEDPSHKEECRAFAEENGLVRKPATTTEEKMRQPTASTTLNIKREELKRLNASTTPPVPKKEMERKMGSSTPGNAGAVKPPSPKPVQQNTAPKTESNDLGAIILKGFLQLLGF